MRKWLAAAASAVMVMGVGASAAWAGEATGNFGTDHGNNSKTTPIASPDTVAQSICAFSGQNPERFLDPTDPNYEAGRTQSWGQIPKEVRDAFPAFLQPGSSCNGHTGFLATGGGE